MIDKNQWWFIKTYDSLIEKSKKRGLNKKKLIGYYEKHHIIPKCKGGTNKKDNLVLLTYREHIIAHRLLIRIYPKSKELIYALYKMINPKSENLRDATGLKMFSLKELEVLRIKSSEFLRKKNLGRKLSEETKNKIRNSRLGKKLSEITKLKLSLSRKRRKISSETRKRISISNTNKVFSDDHKKKISESNKGRPLSIERKLLISGSNSNSAKKVIDKNGKIFQTITECANFYKISVSTLKYRINKHPELGFKIISDKEKYSNKLVLDNKTGIVYKSIKSCSKHINRSEKFISNICKGKTLNSEYNLSFVDRKYCLKNNINPI